MLMFQMSKVGKTISAARKAANMTQMELADQLGISFQAVSNWERGVSQS
ncbi:MAG: helix-turn-helix transcriptional regulator [Lachnospiraceae bacterium]|nr:helix-turn-helix transcriptional regulator [Lachnospiraceae bacterium]